MLIGEHVDHQGGLVLPMALKEGVAVAWGPRPDRSVRVVTLDENAGDRFTLGPYAKSGRRWADLLRGLCAVLESRGIRLPGIDLVVAADLPARKGLASSAAFLVACLKAFFAATGRSVDPVEAGAVVQRVEAEWAGVRCGAMDPYVAAVGRPGEPLLLDCRDLSHERLPPPAGASATFEDTGVSRALVETPYNQRRAELEAGLARLAALRPGAWRDVPAEALEPILASIPDPARKRVRHAVTEIDRVRRAADALRRGDSEALGLVMDEGHRSLSKDFECSTPAIDDLVARRREEPGVLGVRLQGAGWGGSLAVLRRSGGPEPGGAADAGGVAVDGRP